MEKYEIIYKRPQSNEEVYCSCSVPMLIETLQNLIIHNNKIISTILTTSIECQK